MPDIGCYLDILVAFHLIHLVSLSLLPLQWYFTVIPRFTIVASVSLFVVLVTLSADSVILFDPSLLIEFFGL